MWTFHSMENFLQDLRYGARMLRNSPGFTAIAVLTLALGIGANTAIFSVVNAVLLKPLPYPDANRVVMLFLQDPSLGLARGAMGNADFLALEQQQQSFENVAAYSSSDNGFTLTGNGEPEEIPGGKVTAHFFAVLGVRPMLGRTFSPGEDRVGQPLTVVVSNQFWREHLRSDAQAIGQSITLTRLLHDALVVVEFSLAAVLLIGSLIKLEAVSPGFRPQRILTMRVDLPPVHYAKASQTTGFYRQLLDKIENVPGVQSAAVAMSLPPNLLEVENPFHMEGQPYTPGKSATLAEEIPISEDYFRTLGVPLIAGRFFTDEDRADGHNSLVINQAMAQRYFGGNAVGKRVQTGDADSKSTWETIVGVVGNVKYEGLGEKDQPTMYVPYYSEGWAPWFVHSMYVVVRTPTAPGNITAAVRSAVGSIDNAVPLANVQTMDELLSQSVTAPRLGTILLSSFATLALLLGAIGIYGVMSYAVTQRTHEIGVRIALGAQQRDVLRLVLGSGAKLALIGSAIGVGVSLALTRFLSSLLFGISPTDLLTFSGVAVLLMAVALVACYLPTRRAMRVDPMTALRHE